MVYYKQSLLPYVAKSTSIKVSVETRNAFDLPMFWHMPELCDLSVSRKRKLCDDVTELFLFLEFKEKIMNKTIC